MATSADVTQLRRFTGYEDTDPYDDAELSDMLDASNIYRVSERLWNEKAASLAALVNTSESGSSRNMGDLHKNALAMAKYFKGLADEHEAETPVDESRFARTRAIIREG